MEKILSQIRLISQKISVRSDATPEERAQLITLSSRLIEINEDLAIAMEIAFSNNPQGNMRPKLTHNLKKINSLVKQLTKQLDRTIYQTVSIKYYAYITGSNLALNASFQLGYKTVNELVFSQHLIYIFVNIKQFICSLLLIILVIVI
ncbi:MULTISPECIES: hypothetical protein [unclassified Microcoleus]